MKILIGILMLLVFASLASAQDGRIEVGVQFSALTLHQIGETPGGVGVRAWYHFTDHVALDTEWMHYPENSSGNFGESSALVGIKTGWRFDRLGVFAKARTGAIHFGGRYFDSRLPRKTEGMTDLGGGLEYYVKPRIALRLEIGNETIFYGAQSILGSKAALGTTNNLQETVGFSYRF